VAPAAICGSSSPRDAPATPDISTLSLHDALPISVHRARGECPVEFEADVTDVAVQCDLHRALGRHVLAVRNGHLLGRLTGFRVLDRKSTRLNSSHVKISYAVFCLKIKNKLTTSSE